MMTGTGMTPPYREPSCRNTPPAALDERPSTPCPPVVTFQQGREFRLDGRRLGLLGSTALHVQCACGHSGRVSVAGLVAKHGSNVRVRDAVSSIRCGRCRKQHIKEVRWLG